MCLALKFELGFPCLARRAPLLWRPKNLCPSVSQSGVPPILFDKIKNRAENIKRQLLVFDRVYDVLTKISYISIYGSVLSVPASFRRNAHSTGD